MRIFFTQFSCQNLTLKHRKIVIHLRTIYKNWTSRIEMNPEWMLSRLSSIPPAYSLASATTTIKKPFAFHYITAVISGTHPENMHLLNFLNFAAATFCRGRQFVS